MRVVVDTNVFISGLINAFGPPGRVIDETFAGAFRLLYDDRIFAEYTDVFLRPQLPIDAEEAEALLAYVESEGEYVSGIPTDIVLPDVTDLPFLEVAIAGLADAIITGNAKHFVPKKRPPHRSGNESRRVSSTVRYVAEISWLRDSYCSADTFINLPPLPVRHAVGLRAANC